MIDLDDIVDWHGTRARVVGIINGPSATIEYNGTRTHVGMGVLRKVKPNRAEIIERQIRNMAADVAELGGVDNDTFVRNLAEFITKLEESL